MSYGRWDRFYPSHFEPPLAETIPPPPPDPPWPSEWQLLLPENPRLDRRRWFRLSPAVLATTTFFTPTLADPTQARLTQATVEVLEEATGADLDTRITQATVEVAEEVTTHRLRATQVWIEVLIPLTSCPTAAPNLCPGGVDAARDDGLPYVPTDPDPCSGPGDAGSPRDDGVPYTAAAPDPCAGSGETGDPPTGR